MALVSRALKREEEEVGEVMTARTELGYPYLYTPRSSPQQIEIRKTAEWGGTRNAADARESVTVLTHDGYHGAIARAHAETRVFGTCRFKSFPHGVWPY